jgi:hypothetical protein
MLNLRKDIMKKYSSKIGPGNELVGLYAAKGDKIEKAKKSPRGGEDLS